MDGPGSHLTRRSLALALAASGVLLVGIAAGCGDDDPVASSSTPVAATTSSPAADSASPQPSVSFVTPKSGWTGTQPVKVKVALQNFDLSPETVGKAAVPGQGHLHFSMDGGTFDLPKYSGANGELATTLGVQGKYSPSVTPTITYRNLPAGEHTLVVHLANNDHTEVGPTASASFTVN